ncbi:retrotransposon protein, putative, ty1-copia subclass [Tanacetum coccineum]
MAPAPDSETAYHETIDKYNKSVNFEQEVACLMLSSMSPDQQRTLEKFNAYDMLKELKTMFEEQAKQELFETVKVFHACKQEDGPSVSSYLLKMKSYLDILERLGFAMPNELGVSLILNSINKDYDQFVQNYNMHSIGKTIVEPHAMLKLHEKGIPNKAETPDVLAIREGRIQKDKKKPQGAKGKDKGKNKLAYAPKPKISSPSKRDNSAKDSICHHCKEVLRKSRKLKYRALSLYVENGMCTTVKAIRSFDLVLPSGLMIVLDNCHFLPTITRVVVPISRLVDNSYIHTFTNYVNSVSKDNMFYFNAIPHDGLYEIDMHNLYPNVSSTYNVSNKRAKHGLDSEYLWHCRLGHINKKQMEKLQRDEILQPTYDESLDKSVMVMFNLMKHKHEVFETFKVFQNEVENQLVTPPYTPQHNRVSERRNQTLLDMVRSMMNLTTLPKYFWVYALESAARILNMVPTKKFERTLYEIWHGKAPKLSYLRVWGRVALIFVARNAEFFENSLTLQEASGSHGLLEMSESDVGLELIQEDDTKPSDNTRKKHNEVEPTEVEPHSAKIPIHRSERISQAPDRYGFYVDAEENKLGDLDEPPNYKAALSDPESDKWFDVIGNGYSRKGAKRKPKTNKSKHGKERTKSSRSLKSSA